MKTASFFTFVGPGRISIARFPPRNTPAGFRVFKPLAPGSWFNSVSQEMYRELYFAQLAEMNALQVWETLHALAAGAEPVLLCWEKPPFHSTNWCHRRMVSEWFATELKLEVHELGPHSHE